MRKAGVFSFKLLNRWKIERVGITVYPEDS